MRIQGRGSATPDWAGPALAGDCPGPGGLLEEETLTYLGQRAKHQTGPDRALFARHESQAPPRHAHGAGRLHRMRRGVFISLYVALAAALAPLVAVNAGPAPMSPSELQANPDRFDGQTVTLQGTVEKLREKVSPDGAPYFKFRLSDGPAAVRVISFGRSPCRDGMQATVEGTFEMVNRLGRLTYYHQVTAAHVTCR